MRKRTKTRTTQLLTMDEIHARPCEVDGVPALFHRWIEQDRFIVQPTKGSRIGAAGEIARSLRTGGQVPRNCDFFEVVRETVALVEYRDGTIDKVRPELIRFIGKEVQHGT